MTRPTRIVAALSSLVLLASLVGASTTLAVGGEVAAGPPAIVIAGPSMGIQASTYYAGYSVYLRKGGFSRVTGPWVVPKATCDGTTSLMFAWVGLDDAGARYLEQAGSGAYCQAGSHTPLYYAWYEMFPRPSVPTSLVVRPGDTIRTTVSAAGSKFTFRIENLTTRKTFGTAVRQAHAPRLAAYWIVESPWSSGSSAKLFPLTRFAPFTLIRASATANGRTGGIDSPLWDLRERWTMAAARAVKASTGGLTGAGSSFMVTWHVH
jgi:hypothetical protein